MKTKENCRALVLGAAVVGLFFQGFAGWSTEKSERPRPSAALRERLASDADVIGIVHWGLNTYTDREWGDYRNYHLALDSAMLGRDTCVRLILQAAERLNQRVF